LRQLELDGGYGLFNRFELFADGFDDFAVTHRSLGSCMTSTAIFHSDSALCST
jgi:hypothetical protein